MQADPTEHFHYCPACTGYWSHLERCIVAMNRNTAGFLFLIGLWDLCPLHQDPQSYHLQ